MRPILLWKKFQASFWFVPTIMALIVTVLALCCIMLDTALADESLDGWWVYAGGAEGARSVLSVVAGSMITVAGVVFSITIVALSLASSQFGPRLLHNFMRDTANQVVLGTFTATFLYCLLVLRTVRGEEDGFVPHVSVSVGVLLAIASLGVFIYFIHHVAVSIQIAHILSQVSLDLEGAIDRLFPEQHGEGAGDVQPRSDDDSPKQPEGEAYRIAADCSGYLQSLQMDDLMRVAVERDLVIQLTCRPGEFVVEGAGVALVWAAGAAEPALEEELRSAFHFGTSRTIDQDIEFGVGELVEVALRALSPGINDPFTAIACLDWLNAALCRLAGRTIPSSRRFDEEGRLRIVAGTVTFAEICDAALSQIRQNGKNHAQVLIRLLEVIGTVAERVRRDEDRQSLARQARLVWAAAQECLTEQYDRQEVECLYRQVQTALSVESSDS